jgi:CBS domain-containing protein
MQVRDFMRRNIQTADPGQSLNEAAHLMSRQGIGFLPVMDENRLVGVLTDRDITVRCDGEDKDPGSVRVRDVMTRSIVCCHDDDDVKTAAAIMARAHVRRLPVLWHSGWPNLIGVVSIDDIADKIDADFTHEILRTERLPDLPAVAGTGLAGEGTVINRA